MANADWSADSAGSGRKKAPDGLLAKGGLIPAPSVILLPRLFVARCGNYLSA